MNRRGLHASNNISARFHVMVMGFKEDIAKILADKFGEPTRKMILDKYSDDSPQELYDVAEHMLSAFMGKDNANKVIEGLLIKYKVRVKKR